MRLSAVPTAVRRLSDGGMLVWVLVGAVAAEAPFASQFFLTARNLSNLGGQMVPLWLAALGQVSAILVGAIDLSVGATAKLSALVTSGIMNDDATMALPAIASALGLSVLVGIFNATMVVKLRFDPLIATLITYTLLRGAALAYTQTPIGGIPPAVTRYVHDRILGVPYPVWFAAILMGLLAVTLSRTRFGRSVYAVGGDAEVARRAGVSPATVRFRMLVLCSTLAGLAGIALALRQGVGDPRVGDGLELLSIVAVVIGGVSIFGGRGRLLGVLGGVLFLNILRNAMNLQGIEPLLQGLVSGLLVIIAVATFTRRER